MRTLLIDAHDTISSVTPTPSVFVQSSTLFISPISSLTPKMNRVRSITYFVRIATFTGPLIVLDTQSSFDTIFGLNPIMIQIIIRSKR